VCPLLRKISRTLSGYEATSQLSQVFLVVLGPSPSGSRPARPAHLSRFWVQPFQLGRGFALKKYGRMLAPLLESLTHRSFCFLLTFLCAYTGRWMKRPSTQSGLPCKRCASTYLKPVSRGASDLVWFSSVSAPWRSCSYSAGLRTRTPPFVMGFGTPLPIKSGCFLTVVRAKSRNPRAWTRPLTFHS